MRNLLKVFWMLVLCCLAVSCNPKPAALNFKGTDITGTSMGGDFRLIGQDGKHHNLSEFRGKVVALFFGYTHCPDVCPTTLLEYATVLKKLGDQADKVQVLFVSVDPERDTPQVLAAYIPHFNPAFIGLTGSVVELEKVKTQYKVVAQKVKAPTGSYSVDHSAGSYLLDQEGKLRVFEQYGADSDSLTYDIEQLLH
ncbi:SCO family protein [Neisseriaceae bacterium TC5R-5]|nr:SCO family protein [Neisseriaceae bacterium TC5R-5]